MSTKFCKLYLLYQIPKNIRNWKAEFKNSYQRQEGFTLIELLVVIGVIGLLASVLVIVINPLTQIQKSRDSQRKSDLAQIQRALEIYYNDNGSYPPSTSNEVNGIAWGSNWTGYMTPLPKDPSAAHKYYYILVDPNTYRLYAALERSTTDPQRCGAGINCPNLPGGSVCGIACNYGVSSSNTTP